MYYAPVGCGLRVELLIIDKSLSIAQEDLYMYWHCEVSVSLRFTKVRDSLRTGFRDGCVSVSWLRSSLLDALGASSIPLRRVAGHTRKRSQLSNLHADPTR